MSLFSVRDVHAHEPGVAAYGNPHEKAQKQSACDDRSSLHGLPHQSWLSLTNRPFDGESSHSGQGTSTRFRTDWVGTLQRGSPRLRRCASPHRYAKSCWQGSTAGRASCPRARGRVPLVASIVRWNASPSTRFRTLRHQVGFDTAWQRTMSCGADCRGFGIPSRPRISQFTSLALSLFKGPDRRTDRGPPSCYLPLIAEFRL